MVTLNFDSWLEENPYTPLRPSPKPKISETPVSDTGLIRQNLETTVDYFQGTAKFSDFQEFKACTDFIFGSALRQIIWTPDISRFSGISWKHTASTVEGEKVYYNISEDGKVHAWYSLPGSYFHSLSGYDQWFVLVSCYLQYGMKCNRIDLKVRDFNRVKSPGEVLQYARLGHVSGIRKYESASNGEVGNSQHEIFTVYLGSKQSEKFLRIYDAKPVHDIDAIDWELQCRDEKAAQVYSAFVSVPAQEDDTAPISLFIGKVVSGAVDFYDEVKSLRDERSLKPDRCNRMAWFQSFRDMCGGAIKLASGQKSATVQRTLAWIDKQVMVVMSALAEGFGTQTFIGWLTERIHASKGRMTDYHEHLCNLCQNYTLPSSLCLNTDNT